MADLSEEELQSLYCWIDEIPLSRTKKNITRDFSDGVLTAEIVHHFLPQLVELHNYSPANSSPQKIENWRTLNRKVFSKLNLSLPDDIIQSVSSGKAGVVEFILTTLRTKIEKYLQNKAQVKEYDYNYDPNDLQQTPEEMTTHAPYGQFEQMRHIGSVNPPRLQQGVGDYTSSALPGATYNHAQLGTTSTRFNHSHLDYGPPDSSQMVIPRAPAVNLHNHAFPSKLHPPTHYHHHHPSTHLSQLHHNSTLPPIHIQHPTGRVPGGGGRGGGGEAGKGQGQKISKLPTLIHARSKTYAGRVHKTGPPPPPSNMLPSVAMAASKRLDSAKQQIRLAEKEQKLYESQEYIQLLQMKVTRLEHLVQIKDMKINELQTQLAVLPSRHPLHKR